MSVQHSLLISRSNVTIINQKQMILLDQQSSSQGSDTITLDSGEATSHIMSSYKTPITIQDYCRSHDQSYISTQDFLPHFPLSSLILIRKGLFQWRHI